MRCLAALVLGLAAPMAAQAADVRVELSGLRAGGTLYVQLQNRSQFMGAERVAGQRLAAPQAGTLSVDLGDVPPGEYALSVWHDDNGNDRFDVDPANGHVLDGIAAVNAENLHSPPTFDQIKVAVPAAGITVPLTLRYGR
ncbi:MAG: DUF2141 domain-containing protein [Sphingomonadaceae bacterium]|nr:DUF2141 domain-containing protein [Sphingomonadaceae bacterium]